MKSARQLFPIRERCIMAACVLSPSKRSVSFGNGILMHGKPYKPGIVTPSAPAGQPPRTSTSTLIAECLSR